MARFRGQMFIVTVVFLVGLVFVVQQVLLQYSYVDMPAEFQQTDYHLMKSVEDVLKEAVTSADICSDAEKNLEEAFMFLGEQTISGYSVNVEYSVNCSNWGNEFPEPGPVNARITIMSEKTETMNKMVVYSGGAFPCLCTPWTNQGCGLFGCPPSNMYQNRSCMPMACDIDEQCTPDPVNCAHKLYCAVKPSCGPTEADLMHLSNIFNAHAEMPAQSNYPYKLCCRLPGAFLGTDCAADDAAPFLNLYSVTNAHVERADLANYPNTACISGAVISCDWGAACNVFDINAACLASISADTNAHVSNCTGGGSFLTKICCWLT